MVVEDGVVECVGSDQRRRASERAEVDDGRGGGALEWALLKER